MDLLASRSRAHPRRAILLALVLALAWEGGSAQAGCGDHVGFSSDSIVGKLLFGSKSVPAPTPCRGPGCSSHPAPPPLTPIETTTESESWGCLVVPLPPGLA